MSIEGKIQRSELWKNWLEVLAIVIAAPWAVYTFYFQNIVLPQKEPPYLIISSHHTIDGQKGDYWIVRTEVSIKNLSKMRTGILGASFNLLAIEADTVGFYDTAYPKLVSTNVPQSPNFPRYYEGKSLTVNAGRLTPIYWKMDPLEEFTRSFVSLVPKKGYDIIRFYAELYASRETEDSLSVRWGVDGSGIIDLQPTYGARSLDSLKDKKLIKKVGLQRFVDQEEFSFGQGERNFNTISSKTQK